jgi:allantoin racemase
VAKRIAFISPTSVADANPSRFDMLRLFADADTVLEMFHLSSVPGDILYYLPKHIIELALLEVIPNLETEGFDAAIIDCCYDPGVRISRELVNMPVVGPLEASINLASYFGHSFSILTDSRKVASWISDLVRLYGNGQCLGVHSLDWDPCEMVQNSTSVAGRTAKMIESILENDGSEIVLIGCTTIALCLELEIERTGQWKDLPFVNPTALALKTAESLAHLYQLGRYNISRRGFYSRHDESDPIESREVREGFHLVDEARRSPSLVRSRWTKG